MAWQDEICWLGCLTGDTLTQIKQLQSSWHHTMLKPGCLVTGLGGGVQAFRKLGSHKRRSACHNVPCDALEFAAAGSNKCEPQLFRDSDCIWVHRHLIHSHACTQSGSFKAPGVPWAVSVWRSLLFSSAFSWVQKTILGYVHNFSWNALVHSTAIASDMGSVVKNHSKQHLSWPSKTFSAQSLTKSGK